MKVVNTHIKQQSPTYLPLSDRYSANRKLSPGATRPNSRLFVEVTPRSVPAKHGQLPGKISLTSLLRISYSACEKDLPEHDGEGHLC